MYKSLGQLIGMALGAALSPCWVLMTKVLNGYFNFETALSNPISFVTEFNHYIAAVEASDPSYLFYGLFPMMIGIILCNLIFIGVFSRFFGRHVPILVEKIKLRTA